MPMAETILITGANRGLGLGLASLCLKHGHAVIAAARDPGASGLLDLQARHGDRLLRLPLDVTDAGSVGALAASLGDRPVDVLVNNAGIIGPERQSTLDMDFAGFLHTLDVNTLGPLRVTQAVLPSLRRAASPRILILSSRMGSLSHAKSDRIAYRASKAAVNKVMQGLATDLLPMGVAIASVHPGWVRTDMGGPEADIDTQESVDGLYALLTGLTLERTGSFFNYDGTTMPW
jgi:NAD(P)-dependent dehydrogenase (short-subunit alcohol dehydrogenase family)